MRSTCLDLAALGGGKWLGRRLLSGPRDLRGAGVYAAGCGL